MPIRAGARGLHEHIKRQPALKCRQPRLAGCQSTATTSRDPDVHDRHAPSQSPHKARQGPRHLPSCLLQEASASAQKDKRGNKWACLGNGKQWQPLASLVLAQSCPHRTHRGLALKLHLGFCHQINATATQHRSEPTLPRHHAFHHHILASLLPRAPFPPHRRQLQPGILFAICPRDALMHPADDQPSPPDPAERAH